MLETRAGVGTGNFNNQRGRYMVLYITYANTYSPFYGDCLKISGFEFFWATKAVDTGLVYVGFLSTQDFNQKILKGKYEENLRRPNRITGSINAGFSLDEN